MELTLAQAMKLANDMFLVECIEVTIDKGQLLIALPLIWEPLESGNRTFDGLMSNNDF